MAHQRSPLDEGVDPMKLLAFCLATEKSQMVAQLAMPRKLSNDLSIPVTGDPLPATFSGSSSMSLAMMIPMLRVGEFGRVRCFLLLFVLTVLESERVSRPNR
jgi:hypothetical protein